MKKGYSLALLTWYLAVSFIVIYPNSSINSEELLYHTKILASDEFQGRFPGSPGETKTINYLSEVFRSIGLQPGNVADNSFVQSVPFVEVIPNNRPALALKSSKGDFLLPAGDAFITCEASSPAHEVEYSNAEMVFIGFGINAPEYGWNDYKDIDVRGKIVVALVSDPGCVFKNDHFFRGEKMTYYGRWKYKFQEAINHGAAGIFVVHNTEFAGYPWSVTQVKSDTPYILINDNKKPLVQGWISEDCIQMILGKSYHELANQAITSNFKPYAIAQNCSISLKNTLRPFTSDNFIALLPGKSKPDEYIFYTAHWDHFGVNDTGIYRGARDNGLSVSALIALAKRFEAQTDRQRSIVFLMPTAEEQGLLGADYYAENPLFPLTQTIGVINMDLLNVFGKTKDITFYGDIDSNFAAYVDTAVKTQGRVLAPDPNPGNGMFYRSDHFKFFQKGVPALFINMGFIPVDSSQGNSIISRKNRLWTTYCYHKTLDYVIEDDLIFHDGQGAVSLRWDVSGTVDDIALLFDVGLQLCNKTD